MLCRRTRAALDRLWGRTPSSGCLLTEGGRPCVQAAVSREVPGNRTSSRGALEVTLLWLMAKKQLLHLAGQPCGPQGGEGWQQRVIKGISPALGRRATLMLGTSGAQRPASTCGACRLAAWLPLVSIPSMWRAVLSS